MSPGRLRWRLALALQVGITAPAQTYVIDAAGGAGSHFTSLGSAIAAVPDGATLLVRAGTYAPFALNGRSLSILGDPGVVISGPVSIANTLAHQPVVLAGLTFTTSTQGAFAHALVDDRRGGPAWCRLQDTRRSEGGRMGVAHRQYNARASSVTGCCSPPR